MSVMLISVGGSFEPVVHVLKEMRPGKVIFFTSRQSRPQVEEKILPAIGYHPAAGFVVTENAEDVGTCTFELLRAVSEEMRKLGEDASWPGLVAYTGGTKTMSAAAVWASSRFPCRLIYIGGGSRTKEGLGIVESGSEKMVCTENPWDKVAWFETSLAQQLFNRAQYGNAASLVDAVITNVSDADAARLLAWLSDAFHAFHAWDVFQHKKAGKLHSVISDSGFIHKIPETTVPGLHAFCQQAERCLPLLQAIIPGQLSRPMAHDLLANAKRRAVLEGKYEDAVARCYSAVEKLAKLQLVEEYGIDNARTLPEQIPESLRMEFIRKFDDGGGTLKFGFKASFLLLSELGDPMGVAYMENEKPNGELLGRRNDGILGHGFKPVGKDDFDSFFSLALTLSGVSESELVSFPVFPV